jgi:hypothetical protein
MQRPGVLGGDAQHPVNDPLWDEPWVLQLVSKQVKLSVEEKKDRRAQAAHARNQKYKEEYPKLLRICRALVAVDRLSQEAADEILLNGSTGQYRSNLKLEIAARNKRAEALEPQPAGTVAESAAQTAAQTAFASTVSSDRMTEVITERDTRVAQAEQAKLEAEDALRTLQESLVIAEQAKSMATEWTESLTSQLDELRRQKDMTQQELIQAQQTVTHLHQQLAEAQHISQAHVSNISIIFNPEADALSLDYAARRNFNWPTVPSTSTFYIMYAFTALTSDYPAPGLLPDPDEAYRSASRIFHPDRGRDYSVAFGGVDAMNQRFGIFTRSRDILKDFLASSGDDEEDSNRIRHLQQEWQHAEFVGKSMCIPQGNQFPPVLIANVVDQAVAQLQLQFIR